MGFYMVKTQFEIELDNGKVKQQGRNYIFQAVSVTDAEARMNDYLRACTEPFEVKSVTEAKLEDVVLEAPRSES